MSALAEFDKLRLWVGWKNVKRGGKLTKVPISAGAYSGEPAKANDPSTWAYRKDVEFLRRPNHFDGIGIMFDQIDESRHLGGIDLDACIDDAGNIAPWAAEILDLLQTYAEVSPSGRGVKAFFTHDWRETLPVPRTWRKNVRRPAPEGGGKEPGIEFYLHGRYFTVTENVLGDFDTIRHVDLETLAKVQEKMAAFEPRPNEKGKTKTKPKAKPPQHHPRRRADEHDLVIAAMAYVANGDLHWNDWSRLGMALHQATGGSEAGYRAFLDWSAKSSKHSAEDCEERWRHWDTSPADDLSAGTIFYEAALGGWKDPRHRQEQEPPPPVSEHDGGRTKPAKASIDPQTLAAAREAHKAYIPDIEAAVKKRKQEAEAKVAELAKLDALSYDLARKEAAKDLELPVGRLDTHVEYKRETVKSDFAPPEIEPWPEPVSGTDVLNDIAAAVRRHVGVPTRGEEAIALWILFAHCFGAATIAPRLAITSPFPECGKTTTLELIDSLVPRSLLASSITSAAVYRGIEKWHPTLIIDEADTFLPTNDTLRGILNSGHKKAGAYTVLTVGENHEPVRMSTWCPMVMALIGKLHPTLSGRSIHIEMQRLRPGETVEPFRSEKRPYAQLARKAARWAEDNMDALRDAEPELPKGFINRRGDNWRPLLAIADLVGGDWPARAREAAMTLSQTDASEDNKQMLLRDIRAIMAGRPSISSRELMEALHEVEGGHWAEFGKQRKPISQHSIARMLASLKLGIQTRTVRDGAEHFKGYLAVDLEEAFERYIPQDPLVEP